MLNNVALGPDGQANYALSVMRAREDKGELASDLEFLPGVILRADPRLHLTGDFHSPRGWIMSLDAKMRNVSDSWLGLHVALPARDLVDSGVIGFGARIAASAAHMVRACIRSGSGDSFQDCFFDKHLLFRNEEADHVDGLIIQHRDLLPKQAEWRELVFFLPTSPFRLTFMDLRVFIA